MAPFFLTVAFIAGFGPKDQSIWDFLDLIEAAYESGGGGVVIGRFKLPVSCGRFVWRDVRSWFLDTLSFVITGQLPLAFHPEGIKWWDYLNIVENVYEVTANADLAVLPGLILLSRKLGSPRVFGEIKPR